jgi:dimethylargininase
VLIAYTRAVSPRLADCELTHLERTPIDASRAAVEHAAYEARLASLGVVVRRLPPEPDMPDAVFVEDTAIVLDEVAVVTRPGVRSRRSETQSVAAALARHRPLRWIEGDGTMDGGDVLATAGRRIYVGASSRTNASAIDQLARLLAPWSYTVIPVDFGGCLHLKSAATEIRDDLMLLNPDWVDPAVFAHHRAIRVDPDEAHAANALTLAGQVIHPAQHPLTRRRLESEGQRVLPLEVAELAKAEAGVTCCSLLVRAP